VHRRLRILTLALLASLVAAGWSDARLLAADGVIVAASDAAKDDEKPAEPYEIGSDKALKDAWKDGFQAESSNKDFRVKIGGRTQVDAVGFTAGPGPNQQPNQAGLDPSLSDTVDLR
jgi:hypothetical protein